MSPRKLALSCVALAVGLCLPAARAGATEADGTVSAQATATTPPSTEEPAATSIVPEAPPEAPPPPPRHSGFVVESGLGALAFLGQFRHVAPPGPWIYTQFGYEPLTWLMFYGYGELAFSDTSEASPPPEVRAFPMYGFGFGMRGTLHLSDRVAAFAQVSTGGMKVDVPNGAFADLGYRNAESLNVIFGARVGVEWYQVDRHLAIGLGVGIREAQGFARVVGGDTPLMLDAAAALRYTF